MKKYYIYFMSNFNNKVIYLGITNNLKRRAMEHKHKTKIYCFTAKYNCNRLVYYEVYYCPKKAIAREKQLMNWKREWKNILIEKFNPRWKDLLE